MQLKITGQNYRQIMSDTISYLYHTKYKGETMPEMQDLNNGLFT